MIDTWYTIRKIRISIHDTIYNSTTIALMTHLQFNLTIHQQKMIWFIWIISRRSFQTALSRSNRPKKNHSIAISSVDYLLNKKEQRWVTFFNSHKCDFTEWFKRREGALSEKEDGRSPKKVHRKIKEGNKTLKEKHVNFQK